MPNHIVNHISLHGDPVQIRSMLEAIKSDEHGVGSVDFNKINPMPESLNIKAGSQTDRGLKAYRDFIDVYTFGRSEEDALKALENIPIESEELFLRQRTDIKRNEWELGKTAWNNIRQHGAPTWYDWRIQNWGTRCDAYGYGEDTIDYCKPNPEYYSEILSKLKLRPEECLMVGNDVTEDMAAQTTGMNVFLLTDCLINRERKDINQYPRGSFEQLLNYIENLK